MHHCYSLDLRTQQIWDYVGDTYVHRLNQSKVDGKFGEMNSHCISHEGACGTCEYDEDSGINEALYSSKVEAVCLSDSIIPHIYIMHSIFLRVCSHIVSVRQLWSENCMDLGP